MSFEDILERVREALNGEPRVGFDENAIQMDYEGGGILTLEGEVADIVAKKLALERAAAVQGVSAIVDRLRVTPASRDGDGLIRDHVRDALLQEPAFQDIGLRVHTERETEVVRDPPLACGSIEVRVANGVVTLDGEVPSLSHKRLAGVLAWWVPGSRDVVNGLGVDPPEEDNEGEIADAVRLVLEKDPFVNVSQIRISVRNGVVTLSGYVPAEAEREMAECDAWYVFGVDEVINAIEIGR